jgi:AcrR family transcriptional regulator
MRRQPLQKRAKISVETIIEAGFISLAKHGLMNTTTVHIAGISPGTLYQYFANKEAVYVAMQRHFVDDILSTLNHIIPELDQMDVRGAVTFLLHQLIDGFGNMTVRYIDGEINSGLAIQ